MHPTFLLASGPMKLSPISRLFSSSKALIMLTTMVGAFVLVALNRLTWAQAQTFLAVTVPAWMLAVGLEDAGKHIGARGAGKADSIAQVVEEAGKKSPPPSAAADKDETPK